MDFNAIQNLDLNASTRFRIVGKSLLKVMALRAGIGVELWRCDQVPFCSLVPEDLLFVLSELGSDHHQLEQSSTFSSQSEHGLIATNK